MSKNKTDPESGLSEGEGSGRARIEDHDAPLVKRARGGDRRAFERLVELHHRRIFNIAFRMIGDREAAADIVQETFLSAYAHLGGFEERARFSTWISTIAMNRCRNYKRAASYSRSAPLDFDPPAAPERSPEAETASREVAAHVQRALNEIAPEQREILVLRDIEGIAYGVIATMLGVEEGTVKSRLHRARQALRSRLEGVWSP